MNLEKVKINVTGIFDLTIGSDNGTIIINSVGEIVDVEIGGQVSYNMSGKISSIGNIAFNYNMSGKVSSIGNVSVNYNMSGKVSSVGNVPVNYNMSGKVSSIGNVSVNYNMSGKVNSIGNVSVNYNMSGNVTSGFGIININNIIFSLKGEFTE